MFYIPLTSCSFICKSIYSALGSGTEKYNKNIIVQFTVLANILTYS